MSRLFGEIRSLLHNPYTLENVANRSYYSSIERTPESWLRLLDMLTQLSKSSEWSELKGEVMPYVHEMLDAGWPDEVRVADATWLTKIVRTGQAHEFLSLAKSIDLCNRNNPYIQKVFRSSHLDWVRHVSFGGTNFKLKSIEAMNQSAFAQNLSGVTLFKATLGPNKAKRLIDSSWLPRLRYFRMVRCGFSDVSLARLDKNKDRLKNLEVLELGSGLRSLEGLSHLARMNMPSLKSLYLGEQHFSHPYPETGERTWKHQGAVTQLLQAPWVEQLDHFELLPKCYGFVSIHGGLKAVYEREMVTFMEAIESSKLKPEIKEQLLVRPKENIEDLWKTY